MNQLFNEDCLETIGRKLDYDYVITSPPDFDEIGTNPKNLFRWTTFVCHRLNLLPQSGLITVFVSDRRFEGSTIAKDQEICKAINHHQYKLLTHKIWVKSYKTNLYRPNFTHILTFGQNKRRKSPPIPDVFFDEFHPIGKYTYNFSLDIVKKFIEAYTDEGDIVYDPFMGSGTTALACIQLNRKFIGSEIVPETYQLCLDRIANEQATTRKMVEETQCSPGPDQSQEKAEEETLQSFFIG